MIPVLGIFHIYIADNAIKIILTLFRRAGLPL